MSDKCTSCEFRNGAGRPVVALDIDGTLAEYHRYFLAFAARYFDKAMPDANALNPGFPLYKHMGVQKKLYDECKLAYRQGGMKRSMPVYEGARLLTESLHHQGVETWICTTRPYLRLDNIDPDTREWLRRNKIKYDAVLFGDDKYEQLVEQIGVDRIVAVVDDLPDQVRTAYECGVWKIYLRDQPYNRANGLVPDFVRHTRFRTCLELQTSLVNDINIWKETHGRR